MLSGARAGARSAGPVTGLRSASGAENVRAATGARIGETALMQIHRGPSDAPGPGGLEPFFVPIEPQPTQICLALIDEAHLAASCIQVF